MKARLAKEAGEKEEKEVAEKAVVEATAREVVEKMLQKLQPENEPKLKQHWPLNLLRKLLKTIEVSLTRGDSSTTDLSPLVIKTLKELQREQQLVRARLEKQDQVNSNIHNLLAELLQRMPPLPNP